jgi:hypothetical protein
VKQEDAQNLVEAALDNRRDWLSRKQDVAFSQDVDSSRSGCWLCWSSLSVCVLLVLQLFVGGEL